LSLLLDVFVLVNDFLVGILLGGNSSLPLLDFADGLLGKRFLVLRAGSFDLFDILESDTLNGSLLSEEFLLLVLALIGLLEFLVESPPCSRPSEPLGFEFSIIGTGDTLNRNL
jgi:hypothetical protein